MYRVNYGNGQVSNTFEKRAEALQHLRDSLRDNGYAFLQRYEAGSADDPGDWFKVRGILGRPAE